MFTTVSKMLVNLQIHSRLISYCGCLTQISIFILFGNTDVLLLTVMASFGVYFASAVSHSPRGTAVFSAMYTVVTPLLNPFIYSLRNTELKCALSRLYKPGGDTRRCSSDLETENLNTVSEFYLLDLSDDPELQQVLFGIFLFMYLTTVLGNLLIILAVSSDPHLQTPMIPTESERHKSFSMCGTHLSVVCFFYGTLLGVYCGSTVFHGSKNLVVASLILRNRDISRTLRRLGSRILGIQDLGTLELSLKLSSTPSVQGESTYPPQYAIFLCYGNKPVRNRPAVCLQRLAYVTSPMA
ncbi:olfactory receptor 7E24-like [Thomomys bottae]